ncbi:N-lysine methyltransferase setd6, partial [Xenoophorus captivus]
VCRTSFSGVTELVWSSVIRFVITSAKGVILGDSLRMVSLRHILRGEEVFNTYGQMANWQLLHMYGFTEPYPGNSNDTADIPISCLYQAATQ